MDKEKYPDGLYVKDDKVTAVMAHPIINATGTLLGKARRNLSSPPLPNDRSISGVVEFYRIEQTSPFTDEDEEVSERPFVAHRLFLSDAEVLCFSSFVLR